MRSRGIGPLDGAGVVLAGIAIAAASFALWLAGIAWVVFSVIKFVFHL